MRYVSQPNLALKEGGAGRWPGNCQTKPYPAWSRERAHISHNWVILCSLNHVTVQSVYNSHPQDLFCCYFIQSWPIGESNQVKEKKQAPTHVNRNHLSNVKDVRSSADRPLLLGCGVFGRCYKMYYRGMSVAVKQFNKHLSTEFDVIKEASLM